MMVERLAVPNLAESLGTTWMIRSFALFEDHSGGMRVSRQLDRACQLSIGCQSAAFD